MTTIADRVREARLAAGLSQTALAGSIFSPSYISLIEAGRREPTDSALGVLAGRLGTTLEFLKYGEDGPNEARTRLEVDYAKLALQSGSADDARGRIESLDLAVVTPTLRVDALTTLARAHEVHGNLDERDAHVVYRDGDRIGAVLTVGRDRLALDVEAAMERGDAAALAALVR